MLKRVTLALSLSVTMLSPAAPGGGALALPAKSSSTSAASSNSNSKNASLANIFKRAVAAYNSGNYVASVQLLEPACSTTLAAEAQAHYYLANALIKVNRLPEARLHYERVRSLAPDTPLAQYANTALTNLYAASSLSASRADKGSEKAADLAEQKQHQEEESLYPTAIDPKFNPRSVDSNFVQIHRRTSDNDFTLWQVQLALNLVPKHIKDELQSFGVKVLITPTMLDAYPDAAMEVAHGDTYGRGYSNSLAMYWGQTKLIYIPEKVSRLSSVPARNTEIPASMLHEMGHAFDDCHNHLSSTETFVTCYKNDVQKLTNSQKNRFPYYTQGGGTGEPEAFAELFSFAMDPRLTTIPYNGELANSFPQTFKYVKNVVK